MRRAELTFDAVDDLVGAYARGRAGLSQPSVSFSPSTLGPLIELAFQSSDGKHGPLLASPWLDRLTQSDLRSALARGQNIWFDGLRRRGFLRGLREAIIRALLYVGTGRAAVDERGFEALRRIRRAHGDIPLSAFKALVREQFYLLLIDTEAALAALPSMLSPGGISMFTSHGPWQIGHTAEAISAAPQEVAVAAQLRGWLVTGATAGKGAPSRRGPTAPRLAAEAAPFPGIAGRSTSLSSLRFSRRKESNEVGYE